MTRLYTYVGPLRILEQARHQAPGTAIQTLPELRVWLAAHRTSRERELTATFVVDEAGTLRLADRHSEHVACAGGRQVRSAGEMTFTVVGEHVELTSTSNQSTGYCPEPASWTEVQHALDGVGVAHPGAFTTTFDFRRCPACGQTNLIKDGTFRCDVCDTELSRAWNFGG